MDSRLTDISGISVSVAAVGADDDADDDDDAEDRDDDDSVESGNSVCSLTVPKMACRFYSGIHTS